MEEIIDELPFGALAHVDTDPFTKTLYIDKNLNIREYYTKKDGRFMPFFLVDNVDAETIEFAKKRLKEELPAGNVIRHIKSADGFFLCIYVDESFI